MPFLDITTNQFYKLLNEYVYEMKSTEEMRKLTMKVLKYYAGFDDGYWSEIKEYVDRKHRAKP